ncbi:MAG: polysaccharide pyruvyl transferase CsaB [Cyanobacteria bacterium KgW148]|nr:polysaccharide pyruvyl transferase CsaB [Cyanobacteria bacterium KgW148]
MTRAIVCGYYGMGNGGDEALLAALLQLLPSHVQPVVLSGSPTETEKIHGVEAIGRQDWGAIARELRRSDVFIWGGGSLMQDFSSWRSPFYYGGLMLWAKQWGLTTIAWAQGIANLRGGLTRRFTRRVFRAVDRLSVRDSGSAQLLESWGYSCLVAPDPVWALSWDRSAPIWQLPAPRVAVALRPHPDLDATKLEVITTALVRFQRATAVHILLVPFQPQKDREIAQMLHQAIPHSTIVAVERPQGLKGLFDGVEMTIGMRFHSLIMGLSQQSRCWAINYDPKVGQLMAEFDLPGCAVADLPTDPNDLCQAWLEYFVNGESLSPTQIKAITDRALIHKRLLEF